MKTTVVFGLFVSVFLSVLAQSDPLKPYPPVNGSFSGPKVPQSPDPLVSYRWNNPQASDGLQLYTLYPVGVSSSNQSNAATQNLSSISVTGPCDLMFDFGQVNAAWFEFDSNDLNGEVEMSISEFNEPAVFNHGSQYPVKTAKPVRYGNTWRLELNKELYEGVRFAWIHLRQLNAPATIGSPRLVCQIKPTNYEGAFACSDTMLTRMWYTGAYDVKLNLLKEYFGAILMERSDRHSWTGDAHTSQAASMVAFGNFDFVKTNLRYTSTQYNGIASYSLYWVQSLIDYYNYTGDKDFLDEMLDNACKKLDIAYSHYGTNPNLSFYGWDERLGGGFENPNCIESQNAYKMLSIGSWTAFGRAAQAAGHTDVARKYQRYADEKVAQLRKDRLWMASYGVHAAADAVNAGFANAEELDQLWKTAFADRLQRMSYSPFNQYFIIGSMARLQRHPEALTTIDDCWGGQLRYGATTFFEVFRSSWNLVSGPNDAPVNNQCGYTSLTHPWSAGITKWLSEEVAGIKPVGPGFASFVVKPHLSAAVTWVKGQTPTLHGTIDASFDLSTGICQLTVPPGTSATLCIPKAGMKIDRVDFDSKQLKPNSEDNDYLYYTGLTPGTYRAKATYRGRPSTAIAEPTVYACRRPVEDSITGGNWMGKYGTKGYVLCCFDSLENRSVLPPFIHPPVFTKNGSVHWNSSTVDNRALRSPDGKRAIGALITRDPLACQQTMTVDIPCKTNQPYRVSLYFVDWDTTQRRSAIELFDLETKQLLAPLYIVRNYSGGKYITFDVDRSVRLRINQVRGVNAALSAIFFD